MSHARPARPAFTLRFRNKEILQALRHTAERLGISMNELAERAIAHELAVIGAEPEDRLTRTVALLRSYRGEGVEDDIQEFASAEVDLEDPLRSRLGKTTDPHGAAASACPTERQ